MREIQQIAVKMPAPSERATRSRPKLRLELGGRMKLCVSGSARRAGAGPESLPRSTRGHGRAQAVSTELTHDPGSVQGPRARARQLMPIGSSVVTAARGCTQGVIVRAC